MRCRVLVVGNLRHQPGRVPQRVPGAVPDPAGLLGVRQRLAFTALMIGRIFGTAVGGAVADRDRLPPGHRLVDARLGACSPSCSCTRRTWSAIVVVACPPASSARRSGRRRGLGGRAHPDGPPGDGVRRVLRLTFNLGSTLGPLRRRAAARLVLLQRAVLRRRERLAGVRPRRAGGAETATTARRRAPRLASPPVRPEKWVTAGARRTAVRALRRRAVLHRDRLYPDDRDAAAVRHGHSGHSKQVRAAACPSTGSS